MFRYFVLFAMFFSIACSDKTNPDKSQDKEQLKKDFSEIIRKHDNTAPDEPKSVVDKFMYMNGYRTAQNMLRDSLSLSLDYLIQGFVDALKEGDPKIPVDSMEAVMQEFSQFMTARMDSIAKSKEIEASVAAVKNLSEAEEFLEKNKNKPGVVTLPSGLQYKVLKEGTGNSPTTMDDVLVHMTSTFPDGTIFDDTRGGEPRAIPNEKMIPGWLEAITKMKEGSRWIVYMHPNLGFGESGAEGRVPPNKMTIVDVELIKIMTPEEIKEFLKKNPPKPPGPGMGGLPNKGF